ncbi:hypothetical protein [Vibrio sp. CAU 1672]|uniref:hypothetical protein n=1 Tax=Vibrio sp. CAU 1672 TaxID=3032594 RepID=UPI0023DBC0A3|nr:hypothetical protein [Vibrio sp. CAU 1672]MDF2156206.1 hypothetical protein [Vibrio sp. CAU 1672]
MSKKFKNVSTDSGDLTVKVNHTVITFHLEPGAEFSIETGENSDIEFSSSNSEKQLVIEPVL